MCARQRGAATAHVRETLKIHPAGLLDLAKARLPVGAVRRAPVANVPLRGPPDAGAKFGMTAQQFLQNRDRSRPGFASSIETTSVSRTATIGCDRRRSRGARFSNNGGQSRPSWGSSAARPRPCAGGFGRRRATLASARARPAMNAPGSRRWSGRTVICAGEYQGVPVSAPLVRARRRATSCAQGERFFFAQALRQSGIATSAT